MERKAELRNKIIEYIKKHDRCPNYASIGSDYFEAAPIFKSLYEDGTLVEEIKVSPKGRKSKVIRVAK